MYQMIPLYVLETKIYHFSTNFLQFEQITDLQPIDSISDSGPHLSELTCLICCLTGSYLLTWPHGPTCQFYKKVKKELLLPQSHNRSMTTPSQHNGDRRPGHRPLPPGHRRGPLTPAIPRRPSPPLPAGAPGGQSPLPHRAAPRPSSVDPPRRARRGCLLRQR
jgi:hypothetical protein